MNRTIYHDALPVAVRPEKPSISDTVPITQVQCRCGQHICTHTPFEAVREIIKCPSCGCRNLLTWGEPKPNGMDPREAIRYRDLVIDSFEDDERRLSFVGVRISLGSTIEVDQAAMKMGERTVRDCALRAAVNHLEERIYGAVRKRGEALLGQIKELRRSLGTAGYNPRRGRRHQGALRRGLRSAPHRLRSTGGTDHVKRRNFIATALAAAAGIALRRPQPEPLAEPITLEANPVPPGWEVVGYSYLFGSEAGRRCYGTPIYGRDFWGEVGSPLPIAEVKLTLPPAFILMEGAPGGLPRIIDES